MGIKRKIKNYLYIKRNYPLSEKTIIPDENKNILIVDSQIPTFDKDSASNRITEIAFFSKALQCLPDGLEEVNTQNRVKKYIKT